MASLDYTNLPENFKLIPLEEGARLTKRNLGVLSMVFNYFGLPQHLHEFVTGILVAGNWDETEWDQITLMRIARNLSSDELAQQRVNNRLKHNSPKFFKWQETQEFTLIERVILNDRTAPNKTKAKYRFPLYPIIQRLFNLPKNLTRAALRRTVEETLSAYPRVTPTPRKPRRKKAETAAAAIIRNINELMELTGSIQAAALYTIEANLGELNLDDFAKVLLQTKDLEPKTG